MPALTPTVLMDLESRMQLITEREYNRLTENLWWRSVARLRGSTGRRDVITWLLSTAQIHDQGDGGNIRFEDLVSTYTEIENKFSGAGLKLQRAQLEDTDGGGMDLAAQWSADVGSYMAYWPQVQTAALLMGGEDPAYTTYDKKPFFAAGHPYNPFKPSRGSFNNILTGAAVGAYPGACPIHEPAESGTPNGGVVAEKAFANLGKVFAYIASIKMPNGKDPRFLRPETLLVPPRLFPRAVQLTSAKFLAQAATGGAASGDVEGVIRALGFAAPVQADELAGFENDTTYFVVCKQIASSTLGAAIYNEREAYRINYYGTVDCDQLGRSQELEWQCHGRNTIGPGHPYLIFKCKGE